MSDTEKIKPAKSQVNHLKNTHEYLHKLINKTQVEKGELEKLDRDFLDLKKKKLIPQTLLTKMRSIARDAKGPKPVTVLTDVYSEFTKLV